VKHFLQSLLVFFALALCGLMIVQWVRETQLRASVQSLTDTVHDKSEAILNLQANVRRDEEEIKRLDGLKNQLMQTVKSNNVQIASLTKDLDKANGELERDRKQIEIYKEALQKANDNIKRQNEEMKTLNEQYKKLAEERNEVVVKLNKVLGDFSDLAQKWNKLQEDLSKTNAPPKNPKTQ